MKYKHLHLDFDETLFDHRALEDWMESVFVRELNIKPGALAGTFEEHHEIMPDGMRLYHHENHFQAVTGNTWHQLDKMLVAAWQADGRPDFCYPETHDVLKRLQSIHPEINLLTYGADDYQRFKISFCRHLKKLGVRVVQEPKRVFLAREFAQDSGILVDDKYPLDLPRHWQHVWIKRAEPLKQPKQLHDAWQISTLTQLSPLLLKMSN